MERILIEPAFWREESLFKIAKFKPNLISCEAAAGQSGFARRREFPK